MNKILKNGRYDDACRSYYVRKFRRRYKIALAKFAKSFE